MPPRVSREEWDRRAAAVGIEWVGDEPIYATKKHVARCLTFGHEWSATPNSLYKGHGCPSCVANSPVAGDEWDRRAVAMGIEWVGDEPLRSSKKHAARCLGCSHEWDVKPSNVKQGQGCPACAGKSVSREEWDRRAAAMGIEWIGEGPTKSAVKHPARCLTCGYEWDALPNNVQQGAGCARCAHRRVGEGSHLVRDEWDRRAAAVGLEWIGEESVLARTKHAIRCLECGHNWSVVPFSVHRGSGCPRCAGKVIPPEEWDRRATAVGIEWVGNDPIKTTSNHAARCVTCGHDWQASPTTVSRGGGCPACGGTLPISAEEWDRRAAAVGIEWTEGTPTRNSTPHPARCLICGHQYSVTGGNVAQGHGCPACAGQVVSREEWNKRAAAVSIQWLSDEPISAMKKYPARCLRCGHEWDALPNSAARGHGCQACAPLGFDPAGPGTVYLIRQDGGPYMKVGITGTDPTTRLDGWMGLGWDVLATWPIPVGRDAAAIERNVIAWWKQSGATRCKRDELPEGQGWTEAVHITAAADEPRTIAYIEELVAEVGGGY